MFRFWELISKFNGTEIKTLPIDVLSTSDGYLKTIVFILEFSKQLQDGEIMGGD